MRGLLVACLTFLRVSVGLGQDFRYTSANLGCAVFREVIESDLTGSGQRIITHRDGIMVVQAKDSSGALDLTAWYDTLTVWRSSDRGRETPDASGVLGGRFRGRLEAHGAYTRLAAPFLPDEVKAIVDLSTALSDFFPRLPDTALSVGGQWRREGMTIIREKTAKDRLGPAERLSWVLRKESRDTVEVAGRKVLTIETIEERGRLRWSKERGPIGWTREIDVTVNIPSQPNVKKSYRTHLRQRIKIERDLRSTFC